MKKIIGLAACLTLATTSPLSARAAEQHLVDYSYTAYRRVGNDVIIDTTGSAKVRISFVQPGMARVRIAPDGTFPVNTSPAVNLSTVPSVPAQVIDRGDTLVVKTADLSLHIAKKGVRVDVFAADDKTPLSREATDAGTSWDPATGEIQQGRVLTPAEHIYGLGQDNANHGVLDRRGTIRDLWTGQQIRSGNVTADYPVPFYLSTGPNGQGYGIFVDNVWHLRFDLGKTHTGRLTWSAPGGPLDYYVINGPSFKSVIDRYTWLTGRPAMLPLWALGYWQSKCEYWNFEEMTSAREHLRKDGIPVDAMVIDSNWPKVEQDYQWGKPWTASGKKPETWLSEFRDRGVRVILSISGPMIRDDSDNFKDGWDRGLFATDGKGNPVTAGYYGGKLMDFTNPHMKDWLWPQFKPLSQEGIAGWWLDLIEPEGEPPQATYFAGKSADIHNSFGLRVYRNFYDFQRSMDPAGRPVILGRAGSAGVQRYGILWTGDINSDWATLKAHVPEAQNAGLSGLNWWTNDSGGFISGFYKHDQYGAHARLYERWMEFTSFLPIARAHKAGPSEPFNYGPSVEATSRKYLKLRYRLLPYIYTSAYEAHTTGAPMLRPLVLEYQNDPQAANVKDEFLFGRDLLVAPVIREDVTARSVYLPAGNWIGLEDGCEYRGGATLAVSAPQDRIPVFVRAGAILPMAPDMLYSGEKPWDPITLEIYPSGTSRYTMYQDDGLTTAYESGAKTETTFVCQETSRTALQFSIAASNALYLPKSWVVRFHLTALPKSVRVDGKALPEGDSGWQFDSASNCLTVPVVAGGSLRHRVVVALDTAVRPRPKPPVVTLPPPETETVVRERPKQIAENLPPPVLPTRIEAANFDKGGESAAYHIQKPGNPGGLFRNEGVPIVAADDIGGGYAVHGLSDGDWLAYSLDAGTGGWFAVTARVVAGERAGMLQLLQDRHIPLITLAIPPRGTDRWSNVGSEAFYLKSGDVMLTALFSKGAFDLSHLTFSRPANVSTPAVIEAEAGDIAGECSIQSDHSGFSGEGFVAGIGRKSSRLSVQLIPTYASSQTLTLRYANGLDSTAVLSLAIGQAAPIHVSFPSTGNWDTWGEVTVPITLAPGISKAVLSGEDQGVLNLDSITVK